MAVLRQAYRPELVRTPPQTIVFYCCTSPHLSHPSALVCTCPHLFAPSSARYVPRGTSFLSTTS
jgi:hypothetical protein